MRERMIVQEGGTRQRYQSVQSNPIISDRDRCPADDDDARRSHGVDCLRPRQPFFFWLTRSHPPAGRQRCPCAAVCLQGPAVRCVQSLCLQESSLDPRANCVRAGDARSIATRVYVILLVLSGQVARTERNSTLIITRIALSLVLRMIVS
jgi:hypothetical protein